MENGPHSVDCNNGGSGHGTIRLQEHDSTPSQSGLGMRLKDEVQSGYRGNKASKNQRNKTKIFDRVAWRGYPEWQYGRNFPLGAAPSSVRQQRGAVRTDPLKIF